MWKTIILFLAIATTVFSVNNKISKAVRVIAFSESESKSSAIINFVMMIVITVLWTIYFSIS
jgi:hypothetical protein